MTPSKKLLFCERLFKKQVSSSIYEKRLHDIQKLKSNACKIIYQTTNFNVSHKRITIILYLWLLGLNFQPLQMKAFYERS